MADQDDFVIDRKPVELAFCAFPTQKPTENVEIKQETVVDELLELVDPVEIKNPTEIRRPASLKSYGCDTESEFEFSGEDSDFEENFKDLREGNADSDEEFDRLVKFSAKIIQKTHKAEYLAENEVRRHRRAGKGSKTPNVHEYDDLPPIESLSIECKSSLIEFGFVSKVVDCMVVIESTSTEVLDFDSLLFDQKGNSIGQVYDIFGQVKTPQYVIRFNSAEEASLIPINMKVYYAPNEEKFSKTPFKGLNLAAANREAILSLNKRLDHQEAVAKVGERLQNLEGVGSDVEFSDDEAEKEFRKQKASNNYHHQQSANRGRKRDRRGGQKVRFSAEIPSEEPKSEPIDVVMKTEPSEVAPPTSSDPSDNPYAEFGCYSGFSGRFGI